MTRRGNLHLFVVAGFMVLLADCSRPGGQANTGGVAIGGNVTCGDVDGSQADDQSAAYSALAVYDKY
jgi:hypothetical protein